MRKEEKNKPQVSLDYLKELLKKGMEEANKLDIDEPLLVWPKEIDEINED